MEVSLDPEVLKAAISALKRRERFGTELTQMLLEKGFAEGAVQPVIDYLRAKGLVNDRRAAEQFVRTHSEKRAKGEDWLRAEMTRLGAPERVIDEALGDIKETAPQLDFLLAQKFKSGDSPARAWRFLRSRGFDDDACEAAIQRYFGEQT